jgi:iron complex transport system ATP-binding protein
MSVITLRDVGVCVPGSACWIVQGASATLEPGQACAILGPNGAGKSTLLRVTAGLLGADRGAVTWGTRAIGSMSARELARERAVVLQAPPAVFDFTALELVLMGMEGGAGWRLAGAGERRRAMGWLERVELEGHAGQAATTLSGGELRRALIARAMASEARWWMLDEPLAGLDLRHQELVLEAIRERCASGGGVVAVMHELGHVERGFERAILMERGQIAAAGEIGQVLEEERLRAVYGVRLVRGEVAGVRTWVVVR